MVAPLPRLTSSLCAHFDADQAYLARRAVLQAGTLPRSHDVQEDAEDADGDDTTAEFGASFDFKAPRRFIVDVAVDDDLPLESGGLRSFEQDRHDACSTSSIASPSAVGGSVNLSWLKGQCDLITRSGGSVLSGDELAFALCSVLRSNKAGDEIACELLDMVGDAAFEMVKDLLSHRKELGDAIQHGLTILKSEKVSSNNQPKMPTYGTQVFFRENAKSFAFRCIDR